MDFRDILKTGFSECSEHLDNALNDLTPEERRFQPTPESNHIDFILWHMVRAEDTLLNLAILRRPELWERESWAEKLGIFDEGNGYGFSSEQSSGIAAYPLDGLMEYRGAVRAETIGYIDSLTEADLSHLPNPRRPEFPVGETLKHIIVEISQHVGQIAYIRGMQRGANS